MSYSIKDFGKITKKRRLEFEQNQEKILKMIVTQAHTNVTVATPVDTGRAKGNWVVGVNEADRSVNEDSKDVAGSAAILAARRVVESAKKATRYILSNNLPYIKSLNEGYSPQARAGYIESNVQRAVKFVLETKKVFKR